jgi:hypothetical protein
MLVHLCVVSYRYDFLLAPSVKQINITKITKYENARKINFNGRPLSTAKYDGLQQ